MGDTVKVEASVSRDGSVTAQRVETPSAADVVEAATSALDDESEQAIHRNMKAICEGRTVIIIAHRWSAVRHAHRLFVIDRGNLVEQGGPGELLAREHGHCQRLFASQLA